MSNQDDGGKGCLLLVLFFLGFSFPLFWIIAIIWLFVDRSSDHQVSAPSAPPVPPPPPDDLANILMALSNGELKDPVTQGIFHPGEKVYLCHVHRLAYHEDSWQEMGCRCMVCGNNGHTKFYTLPQPIAFPQADAHREIEIEFRDID